jgi:hypothetical protein
VRRFEAPVLAVLLVAAPLGMAYGLGYTQRLEVASTYYQRIHAYDLPAFEYLRNGTGTVAASWTGAYQDEGSVNAWLVQGLSKRQAFGPGAPWLSTLSEVGPGDVDMQRLFSGSVGLENGHLQIAGTRTGGLDDPSVYVNIGGFYYPLLYLNSYANGYPVPVEEGVNATILGDGLVVHHPALQGGGELVQVARLEPDAVNITFTFVGGSVPAGAWEVWLWPAYFRPWDDVRPSGNNLETTQAYRTATITTRFEVLTPRSDMLYYPMDPHWGIQSIRIRSNGTAALAIRVSVQGGEAAGPLQSFDEVTLISRYGVTNVLLWKNTGWEPRFDVSPRYHRGFETQNLVVYSVVP